MQITDELIADAKKGKVKLDELMLQDQELYNQMNLKIITKAGTLIPFKLNNVQRVFDGLCNKMMTETGRVRIIVLKFRQPGISTYIGSRIYKGCSTQFNQEGKVVSHDKEAALKLFKMYQLFFDNSLPHFQPMTKYSSKQELSFANPSKDPKARQKNPGLQSNLSVYTAKASGIGRGATIRKLHCSEVPQWLDAEKIMLGLLNTVPGGSEGAGTEIFIESTAKGVGDYFYKKFYAARNKEPGEEFRAVFLPWYLHESYTLPVSAEFAAAPNLTEEEDDLCNNDHEDWEYDNPETGKKRLSLGQIAWRRQTIASVCNKSVEEFQQEYPLTHTEAFKASGLPFFDQKALGREMARVAELKPVFRGEIEWFKSNLAKVGTRKNFEHRLIDLPYGQFTIWRKPEPGEHFVFGADVGEGVKGGDESVCDVISTRDGYHCAQWKGLIAPDQFADVLFNIGKMFNWAYGSPEVNSHGVSVLARLRDLKYPQLYMEKNIDRRVVEEGERMGWRTTIRSRFDAIDTFRQMFRDHDSVPNSSETLMQMSTFVKILNKWQAQPGCHDDCVMSYAIACIMLSDRPKRNSRRLNSRVTSMAVRRDPVTGFAL